MQIIGIAGGSASGKTTLSEKLAGYFSEEEVKIIHMDTFFKNPEDRPVVPSHINGEWYRDDNCPDTVDWVGYHNALNEAIAGTYSVVIVEGLLVLWDKETLEKLDLKIFVDCRPDQRIIRRISRNMQRGQTYEFITDIYLNMVRFRHDQYVEPTKWCADLIVNGAGDTTTFCDMCVRSIREKM